MSFRQQISKFGALFRRRKPADDLEEEMCAHLEMEEQENLEAGMPPEEAHYAALRRFGNVASVQERSREMWGWEALETLWQDLRFGLRQLRRSPGFTAVAVLTLALGIGANAAIFNVLDAVLLRLLPVKAPKQLVMLTDPNSHGIWFGSESGPRPMMAFSEFAYLHDHNDVFSGIFATSSDIPKLEIRIGNSPSSQAEEPETARVQLVSGDYFSVLGVKGAAGRVFTGETDRARGSSPLAVISYAYWKARFGLDPAVLAKTVRIGQTAFAIIGVAPSGFSGTSVGQAADVWVPLMMQDAVYPGRDLLVPTQVMVNQYAWLQVMARLKPGVSLAHAQAAINVEFRRLLLSTVGSSSTEERRRGYLSQRIDLQPGRRGDSPLRKGFANPLLVLMGIVGLVLLIACANVANLLLARGAARQKEFAVRLAVGAGRFRLVRQLLLESLLLVILGAALGAFLARWVDALLLKTVVGTLAGPGAIQLNLGVSARLLGFTALAALLTTALVGVIPALRATALEISSALKSTSGSKTGGSARRFLSTGNSLVIAQVAISMVLLVGAGLFVHSLARLTEVNLGYNRDRLLLFRVDAAPAGYRGPALVHLNQGLLARVSALPGVRAATLSENGLFQGSESRDPIAVEGYTPKAAEEMHSQMDHVGPAYFSTLGIPLLRGREIGLEDSAREPRAAVINSAFARKFYANSDPLGKHVRDTYPGNPADMEIVGVVADAKYHTLREDAEPRIFAPVFRPLWEQANVVFEVRATADAGMVAAELRQAVRETDPALPAIEIETMSGLVERSMGTDRLIAMLASCFGALALVLAAIGLYGVMSYAVARRSNEIGIRMALGARRGSVLRLVLRDGSKLTLLGAGCGLAGSLALTHFLSSLLYGVKPTDPLTLVAVSLLLLGIALLACYIPARRATQVDPTLALRQE
jgi:predicted permease